MNLTIFLFKVFDLLKKDGAKASIVAFGCAQMSTLSMGPQGRAFKRS
jgi:hypothetical protein